MKIAEIRQGASYLFSDVDVWGGKGDGLLRLAQVFNVPQGFVLSSDTFGQYLSSAGLDDYARRLLSEDPKKAYESAKKKFSDTELPRDMRRDLKKRFEDLESPVAVRSSSSNEDGSKSSFAGQHETILGVSVFDELETALKDVWASSFTPRAIEYRRQKGIVQDSMAVVVQEMVFPSSSGVAYSPSPNNQREILIESAWGLCTSVVDGRPVDIFRVIDTVTGEMTSDISNKKSEMDVYDKRKRRVVTEQVPKPKAAAPSLDRDDVLDVAKTAKSIEKSYGMPMDLEFALDGRRVLYVLQARPITGLNFQEEEIRLPEIPANRILGRSKNIRKGGKYEGPAVVVNGIDHQKGIIYSEVTLEEANKQFKDGFVLVSPEVPPQLEDFVTNAKAMVVTECGTTGHAAAIAAEKGILYMGRVVSSDGSSVLRQVRTGEMVGIAATRSEGIFYRM